MARRKKHAAHANHERWLVSYADFITLLFAFFVVMFASSQVDKNKAKQLSEAVENAFDGSKIPASVREILGGTVDDKGKGNGQMKGPGGSQPTKPEPPPPETQVAELLPSMDHLLKQLDPEIRSGKMKLTLKARGLVITLSQAAFFPSGGDTISEATFGSIEKVAAAIRVLPNAVRLEGHTDSVPIHSARFRSNWDLSAARSIAMLQLLSTRYSIAVNRLAVAGYAETVPVAPNDSEEGRARNRRVDIVILSQQGLVKEPAASASDAARSRTPAKVPAHS